jgi:uncharacterized Zn finger protein
LAKSSTATPFLIFQMRGMTREDFLAPLGQSIPAAAPEEPPEPLPDAAGDFWKPAPLPPLSAGPDLPALDAALPRRLGAFPF